MGQNLPENTKPDDAFKTRIFDSRVMRFIRLCSNFLHDTPAMDRNVRTKMSPAKIVKFEIYIPKCLLSTHHLSDIVSSAVLEENPRYCKNCDIL